MNETGANTNIRYRLMFSKTDRMIYIGHLDLLRLFHRTIRRTGLPIAYSLGFNPHQLTTFAAPLALGTTGLGEVLDIQFESEKDCDEIKESLNALLPYGLEILKCVRLESISDNCASLLRYADYTVQCNEHLRGIEMVISGMLSSDEINIERTVKKKTKTVNIRPFIRKLQCSESSEGTVISTNIATGSNGNLKADTLLEYIYSAAGTEFRYEKTDITRTNLYRENEGELLLLCP